MRFAGLTSEERTLLSYPPDAVSSMVGNSAARATVISAFAATSCCSASATSGRRVSSSEGSPATTCGTLRSFRRAVGHVERLRRLADQHRQRIDRLPELLLQRRQRGVEQRHGRFLLRDIEAGGRADLLLQREAAQDLAAVLQILLRDLDALAQLERLQVSRGDARDDGEGDGLPIVAAGDRQSAGGIARGAVLAPEVELVARGQYRIEDIEDAHAFAGSVAFARAWPWRRDRPTAAAARRRCAVAASASWTRAMAAARSSLLRRA